jgi:hypothetical protein
MGGEKKGEKGKEKCAVYENLLLWVTTSKVFKTFEVISNNFTGKP